MYLRFIYDYITVYLIETKWMLYHVPTGRIFLTLGWINFLTKIKNLIIKRWDIQNLRAASSEKGS